MLDPGPWLKVPFLTGQSWRNATTGSTRAARRAGQALAVVATTIRSTLTTPRATGMEVHFVSEIGLEPGLTNRIPHAPKEVSLCAGAALKGCGDVPSSKPSICPKDR